METQPDFEIYEDEKPLKDRQENIIKPPILTEIKMEEPIEKEVEIKETVVEKKEEKEKRDSWNQGDGRRADQVVIYESDIPSSIKNKITPHKGTHFKFINKEDENHFLRQLQSRDNFTAIYTPSGKKDITITRINGDLVGNIHLLHVNGPDIHTPSKYYVKLYLYNFENEGELKKIKERIHRFFNELEKSSSRPNHQNHLKSNKNSSVYLQKKKPFQKKPFYKKTKKQFWNPYKRNKFTNRKKIPYKQNKFLSRKNNKNNYKMLGKQSIKNSLNVTRKRLNELESKLRKRTQ
jgi:hypothetical protein